MLDVLFHCDADDLGVIAALAVTVEEVGIVQMGLKLADETVIFVNAALVGGGGGTFIAAGPFSEHACGIAVVFHDLGKNDVLRSVRFLAYNGIILVHSVIDHGRFVPVFLVAAHVGVAGMLSCHKCCAGRGAYRTAGIGLRETHAFGCHVVQMGGTDVLLSVASQVAVTHVVTKNENDVGLFSLLRHSAYRKQGCTQGQKLLIVVHI